MQIDVPVVRYSGAPNSLTTRSRLSHTNPAQRQDQERAVALLRRSWSRRGRALRCCYAPQYGPVAVPGPDAEALQVLADELHLDVAPAAVGVECGIVGKRIHVGEIVQ